MKQIPKTTIATLAGHSALEICLGAKKYNFRTLVVAQKGREKTYSTYFNKMIDDCIIVDDFRSLTDAKIKNILKEKNAIFIPHRYVQVYCDLRKIEKNFPIPIFGNRYLLKYEEREAGKNQYQIMDEAGIPYPIKISNPKAIDRLVLVKVKEAQRTYERAFFFANNYKEFLIRSGELIKNGKITRGDLASAVIEEYLVGAQVNFNFFYSSLTQKLELLGTDMRRQTNIDGYLRIPARQQLEIEQSVYPSYIESGHVAVTVKESLLEKAFALAEKLLRAARTICPPGIIGPFALQTAVLAGPPQEKLVVFDISLRMPGSPGTVFTPYSYYLYDRPVTFGERIAMEIEKGIRLNTINKITT